MQAVRGQTKEQGATKTSTLINVGDFFVQQILPDVQVRAHLIAFVLCACVFVL